jgi:outer membrane receptor protein involved in Fe transport
MNFRKNQLCASVRLALGALVIGSCGTAAFAQDAGANQAKSKTLETVTVTGSLIRRVDVETASPVVTIDRAAIQATGRQTLGDLVQQLPAMTGGNVNPQVNNGGGTGGSSINLRGLGAKRTLILVNGQRLLSKDPNAIPADAIERIEVLPTGASATYGSDAIGGVVNFILRKNYQGATFSANVGQSDRNDGAQSGYNFTFGQTSEKGSIMAGINYNKQDGVESRNRAFSKNALSLHGTQATIGGSPSTPYGNIQLPAGSAAAAAFANCSSRRVSLNPGGNAQVMTPANYHCYTAADRYNYAAVNLIMTPQERTGGFISGDYRLGDHVTAYLDAVYEKTSSNFQLAPAVFGANTGYQVDPSNAFNPVPGRGWGGSGASFKSRLAALGYRTAATGRLDAQINTGMRGDFTVLEKGWNWDVGYNYGHQSVTTTTSGLVNQTQLYSGPSVLNANGTATCPAGTNPVSCQFDPFNLYSPGSVAALRQANTIAVSNDYSIQKSWHVGVGGELFSLPAGAVQLAVGYEYRKEYEHTITSPELLLNPATGSCILGSQCVANMSGGYNSKDLYAEALIPILSNLPAAQSLSLSIGDRYTRVNTFGSTNNYKFALEWKPIDDLLVRGTMEQVFRAPNLGELFSSSAGAPSIKSDPCTGYRGAPAGSPLSLACQYVPTNGTFENVLLDPAIGGQGAAIGEGAMLAGFPIKPESGKSFDLGLVYSPSYVPGLSTTLDFWHVYLNNTITSAGLQSVLDLCAAGQTVFCRYISRTPAGENAGQLTQSSIEPVANLGSLGTGGVDWSANYKLPQFGIGQFNIGVNATYLKYFTQNTAPGQTGNVTFNDVGHFLPFGSAQQAACPSSSGVCLFPRWRAQAFVDWQHGGWSAQWRMRFISRFQNGGAAGSTNDTSPNGVPGTILKYGATTYNDVSVGYNLAMINTRLDFGVNNLFDKQPPMLYANNTLNANTDPSDFDLMGRYWWARVTVKF